MPTRLTDLLDPLIDRKVAIIQGPAGFHKSELVRAWLSLHDDIRDNYIQTIVRKNVEVHTSDNLREVLTVSPETDVPMVVWMDNHDYIKDNNVLIDVLEMVDAAPHIRLILSGRSRPALPLGSLALKGDLVEINTYDLTYTFDEVLQLLDLNAAELHPGVEELLREFEGWPIAIELLRGMDIRMEKLSLLRENIDGYLREEVLHEINPADIALLEDLSPLPDFTLTAASSLVSVSNLGPKLASLAAEGIPLTWEQGNLIRLNRYLRGYLVRSMERTDPERSGRQNRRAATWLQRQGQGTDAIEHALQAQDEDLVFDLLMHQVGHMLPHNIGEARKMMEGFFGRLPETYQLHTLQLLLLTYAQQEMESMTALLAMREEIPEDATPTGLCRFYIVVLDQARHSLYSRAKDLVADAVSFADNVLDNDANFGQMERAAILTGVGLYHLFHGRITRANAAFQEAANAARIDGCEWLTAFSSGALALTHALQGGTSMALRAADESLAILERIKLNVANMAEPALLAKAIVALDMGRPAEAREHFDTLMARPLPMLTGGQGMRAYVNAMICVDQNNAQRAVGEISAFREAAGARTTPYLEHLLSSIAFDAYLKLKQPQRAVAELSAMQGHELPVEHPLLVTCSARLDLLNDRAEHAYETLNAYREETLTPWRNSKWWLGILMTFGVAAGASGHPDEALDAYQKAGVLADRIGLNVSGARHTTLASSTPKDAVKLTKAELSALERLDSDLPLSKVADQLYISPNTLKTHLRRIYKKLDVSGRDEAIERAKILGLIK